ncbi:MAG: malto-oligosyltrehalose trehalohydrolase [Bryobacterales bacterium]|nr:malto-oligosyltrehalose trehalohydrolase [Bryobacterales bacterium]
MTQETGYRRYMKLGARYLQGGACEFLLWAPQAERVDLHLVRPEDRLVPMRASGRGYYCLTLEGVRPGARYFYRLNGRVDRPDPASRCQPEGVHGPSEIVDPSFDWHDRGWSPPPLKDQVLYELHVGVFTPEGGFESLIPCLEELKSIGITTLELMPVSQFPGTRNWGYDGVYPFAPQYSYGGPAGLKRLVDACHRTGLAVVLDVVYNHLGPEGNYISEFGPYFTDRYRTPWGRALNFDGAYSDEVRRFFLESALEWIEEYHCDGLRLDAVDKIIDTSAYPFLQELVETVKQRASELGRAVFLTAESDANDSRLIRCIPQGGIGFDAQWSDDFHHSLHVLLTGERQGYYESFGELGHLAKAFREAFTYSGQYSHYRRRRYGNPAGDLDGSRFIVCSQNHDQAGNRMLGERLAALVPFEKLKLAAGCVLLAPYVPLLFMGQEYGETAPFLYFVSHGDPELVEAVRQGRSREFSAFRWQGVPPDPQAESTFLQSRLDRGLREREPHRTLLRFYRELIRLRRRCAPLGDLRPESRRVSTHGRAILVVRRCDGAEALTVFHFGDSAARTRLPATAGAWRVELDSSARAWRGPGGLSGVLISDGELELDLNPSACLLLLRQDAAVGAGGAPPARI